MSEKKKNTTQNEEKYFGKRGSIQENATKTEKIIGYVLVGVAVLAILLIIIISLLTGSEKNKIAKRFDSLTKDNVFTYVTYEKLQEKVQNGEEFEVVLVDDRNSRWRSRTRKSSCEMRWKQLSGRIRDASSPGVISPPDASVLIVWW